MSSITSVCSSLMWKANLSECILRVLGHNGTLTGVNGVTTMSVVNGLIDRGTSSHLSSQLLLSDDLVYKIVSNVAFVSE